MGYIYKIQICLAQNLIYTVGLKPPAQTTLKSQCSELSHAAQYMCCPRNAFISGIVMQRTHNI